MTAPMSPRPIADLDVSVAEAAAVLLTPKRSLERAASAPLPEAERLRSGRLAEYAHLLCDADPDAETKPFPYLVKSPRTGVAS